MKTYLIFAWVGLWLLWSCSTSDPSPPVDTIPPGSPVNVTIITHSEEALASINYGGDAQDLQPLGEGPQFQLSARPTVWHQNSDGFSAVLPGEDCGLRAILLDAGSSLWLEQPIFTDMDPCRVEVLALSHAKRVVYAAYSYFEDDLPVRQGVRKLDMEDGTFIEVNPKEAPVDLDWVGEHLFVLTTDGDALNTVEIYSLPDLSFTYDTEIGFEAELLMRLGSDRLLVGFPDAHYQMGSSSLQILENVQYREGTEPRFSGQQPLVSPAGDALYYRYPTDDEQEIGAMYRLGDRTAVLYDFKNFLSPDQREFQYDIGTATAVGFDAENQHLLIGYQKASTDGGGILRLEVAPEFRFVDQMELPATPLCILTY